MSERFLGINLRAERADLADGQLARSINADLHETVGTIQLRRGRTAHFGTPLSSLVIHSVFRNANSATRYQAAGTTLFRTQAAVTDFRALPLSGDTQTDLLVHKPLNDRTYWTFAADRGAMQKDDASVTRRWGLVAPAAPQVRDRSVQESIQYDYRFGLTHVRFDIDQNQQVLSVAHESNPSGTAVGADRDASPAERVQVVTRARSDDTCQTRDLAFSGPVSGLCTGTVGDFTASGGCAPYRWALSGGGSLLVTGSNSQFARLVVPENAGGNVAGLAYKLMGANRRCDTPDPCSPAEGQVLITDDYNCNGASASNCQRNSGPGTYCVCASAGVALSCPGGGSANYCGSALPGVNAPVVGCGIGCPPTITTGFVCDLRTQSMIDQGCRPCALFLGNAVITVSDAKGQSISRTLSV